MQVRTVGQNERPLASNQCVPLTELAHPSLGKERRNELLSRFMDALVAIDPRPSFAG